MHKHIFKIGFRLFFSGAILFLLAAPIFSQGVSKVTGRWVWEEVARKNKSQTKFSLVIKREGKVVQGTYSVDDFINGKWQGEDGNQTPFRGRVVGNTVEVEFDPSATVPGYQENVVYKAPDGRKPSYAVISFVGNKMVWRLVNGARIENVPARVALRREPLPK